jgi:preprotein translocase subunit SecA
MNNIWGDFARMIFHVQVVIEGADGDGVPPAAMQSRPSSSSSSTRGGSVSYSGGVAPAGALALAAAAAGTPAEAGMAAENGYDEPMLPPPVEQRRVDHEHQIGRNDPCWCGSGKKFKKCHGA